MARVSPPPPKLTPELVRAIRERTKEISVKGAPPSAADWVASYAGVRTQTVKRWARRAFKIRALYTGQTADKWIRFIDALDAFVAQCAEQNVNMIHAVALDEDNKKHYDARVYLDKRALRFEESLDAMDVEIVEDTSVANMPQELFDALTQEEQDAQDEDLLALQELFARVAARHEMAAQRVNDARED